MERSFCRRNPIVLACLITFVASCTFAYTSKVMGEIQFEGATKLDKDSGVWVDGGYVGYVKELKGDKKVSLLPGEHDIAVRQSGYDDFVQKIVVEPGQVQIIRVSMHLTPRAKVPAVTSTLKVTVQPVEPLYFSMAGSSGMPANWAAPCTQC